MHYKMGSLLFQWISLNQSLVFFEIVAFLEILTVAEYSWPIANNFVIGVYCKCLEILSQIAFSSVANYFRSYRKKQCGIESVGIYSRHQ